MAITKAAFSEGCGLFATPRGINQPAFCRAASDCGA
jgi:hypothetical protein